MQHQHHHHHYPTNTIHDTHINCKQTKNSVKHRIIVELTLNSGTKWKRFDLGKKRQTKTHKPFELQKIQLWGLRIGSKKLPLILFQHLTLSNITNYTKTSTFRWCLSQTQKSLLILSSIRRFLPAVFYLPETRLIIYSRHEITIRHTSL